MPKFSKKNLKVLYLHKNFKNIWNKRQDYQKEVLNLLSEKIIYTDNRKNKNKKLFFAWGLGAPCDHYVIIWRCDHAGLRINRKRHIRPLVYITFWDDEKYIISRVHPFTWMHRLFMYFQKCVYLRLFTLFVKQARQ